MYKKDIPYNDLPVLPPKVELETKTILKKDISANNSLAELKGWSFNQSNPILLFQSIALQEAKSSTENVVCKIQIHGLARQIETTTKRGFKTKKDALNYEHEFTATAEEKMIILPSTNIMGLG